MMAMLLAAGRGSRLRPLTDDCPKPLLRVGGEPLIAHQLRRLAAAGIGEVVVNLGWLGEQIPAVLGDGSAFGVSLRYSDEGWPALETGGGIVRALPLLGEGPFLLLNADLWGELPLTELSARGLQAGELGRLLLVDNPAHKPVGDFRLDGDRVRNPPATGEDLTYAGAALLHPELFAQAPETAHALAPLLRRAADDGALSGLRHRGEWIDVGTPERLAALRAQHGGD